MAKLTDMVYREAATGFTLPGLCKFKLVRRREPPFQSGHPDRIF